MLGDSVRRRQSRFRRSPASESGPRPPFRWRVWIPSILAALVLPFAIGYAVAALVLFPAPEVIGVGIAVPRLVGLELRRAEEAVREAGLGGIEVTELPHPDRPVGVVTAQAPLEGQQLRAGSRVRVAVSSGKPRVLVPDVVGFSAERASSLLTRLGFEVTRVDEENDEEEGRVIRVNPAPGTERDLPSNVTIMVSTGPPRLLPIDTLMRVDTVTSGDTTIVDTARGTPGAARGIR